MFWDKIFCGNRGVSVCIVVMLSTAPVAWGQTTITNWIGASGAWDNKDNWHNGVPTDTKDAVINVNGVTVTIDAGVTATCASLVLGDGTNAVILAFATDSVGTLQTSTANGGSGNVTIHNNATLQCQRSSTAGEGTGRTITIAGNLDVLAGGVLTADAMGFSANRGPGAVGGHYQGASHGGVGGTSSASTYGSFTNPTSLGSGSRAGSGGGAIIVQCSGAVSVAGRISADGANVPYGPAGGSINITAATLTGAGIIRANGGNGSGQPFAGGGGGGRISLDGVTTDTFTGTLQANGGATNRPGHAGTIYLNAAKRTALTIGGAGNLSSIRLGSDGTNNYTFGSVVVEAGGTLEVDSNPLMNDVGGTKYGGAATLIVSSLNVKASGILSADALGFRHERGPNPATAHYEGATHGGVGANSSKTTYGSFDNPINIGNGSRVGDGGGAIIIQCSGTVTAEGRISADGQNVSYGPAGGSINITAATLTGTGIIRANGGNGSGFDFAGGGGGGRISLNGVTTDTFTGTLQANGGSTNRPGHAGTIYLNAARRSALTIGGAGNLTSLRLGSDGTNNYTFGSVVVEAGGLLEVDSNPLMNDVGGTIHGGAVALIMSSLDVKASGVLSADQLGFRDEKGPGRETAHYVGSTHGGRGGSSAALTYGSITNPVSLGSGNRYGDAGGAVIVQCSGAVNVAGRISADGQTSGAAGGSVNITAATLSGPGIIRVKGGDTSGLSRAGGGGRIAIRLSAGTDFGSVTFNAFGGRNNNQTGATAGAAGMLYLEDSADGSGDGELIVDNNGNAAVVTTLISPQVIDRAVGDVILRNTANLEINDASVDLTVSGSWTNNATQTLTEGTITFDKTSAATIDSNNQAFHNLIFDGIGGEWTLSGNPLTANSDLTITNGTLNVDGQGMTVTGTYANSDTLKLHGDETASFTNDTDSGLTIFDGGVTATLPALVNNTYFDLRFDNGAGVWTLPNATTVNRHLDIANGSLNSGDFSIQVAGNWSNTGTFLPGTAEVTFTDNGLTSTISGSTDFNHFTCTTAGKALVFEAAQTQTINGTLTLNGQAAGTRITIRSTSSGSQAIVDARGARSAQYVDVQDSRNLTAPAIDPTNSVDRGNTLLWFDLVATVTATPNPVVISNPTNLTTAISGGSGNFTFSWTGPNGFTSNQQSPGSILPPLLGVNTYTLTIFDNVALNTTIITYDILTAANAIFANPSISPTALVLGQNAMLSSTPSGGSGVYATFQWTGPNGFTSNLQNPGAITPTNLGANTYTLTVIDSVGLSDTASVTVNVAAAALTGNPNASPAVISLGNSFDLTSDPQGGSGIYTSFSWSGPGGFSSTAEDPGVQTPTSSGVLTYTLTVTDSYGLVSTETLSVYVLESALIVNPSAQPALIALGESTTLSSQPFGGTGVYVAYNWSGPFGFTSNLQNPGLVTPISTGTYTYVLTVTDASGLVASASVDVIVGEPLEKLFIVTGSVRYRASGRSTAEHPRDVVRMKVHGLELHEGDRVSAIINGSKIGDLTSGDFLTIERRLRARGQLGSGPNVFHKCRIRYQARRRGVVFTAARGLAIRTNGSALVQAQSGISSEVRVAILVDRTPADGIVDTAAVMPLQFKVKAKTDAAGLLHEKGKSMP